MLVYCFRASLFNSNYFSKAKRTLEILKSQSSAHASFLSDGKNVTLLPAIKSQSHGIASSKRQTSPLSSYSQPPITSGNLTSSLASARGKPISNQVSPNSSLTSASQTTSQRTRSSQLDPHSRRANSGSPLENSDEEPFFKFYSTMTTVVSKTHSQTRDKAKFTNNYIRMKKNNDQTGASESYYVVPDESDSINSENYNKTQMALEAYADTFERQKDIIKNSLAQLRSELQSREQAKIQTLNQQIEELNDENAKLKIQLGKMKSRWEELKESARKRR